MRREQPDRATAAELVPAQADDAAQEKCRDDGDRKRCDDERILLGKSRQQGLARKMARLRSEAPIDCQSWSRSGTANSENHTKWTKSTAPRINSAGAVAMSDWRRIGCGSAAPLIPKPDRLEQNKYEQSGDDKFVIPAGDDKAERAENQCRAATRVPFPWQ